MRWGGVSVWGGFLKSEDGGEKSGPIWVSGVGIGEWDGRFKGEAVLVSSKEDSDEIGGDL